ncbi:predicted protein [Streptomyces viridosporus ATCC 14672]|uniref:Predicted protein n=1 Tax=Streptomyces viridosporus (strain ATCC 14672 / DSM 40746 / JCM 4963 / KCTC 9882 / NRRL B-12104 / FH 1290) TaxID=566461 RepID=D6A6U9_STRV1|nr:predicted protein [Streptomyces viridosporus ATCC 14672]
MVVPAAPGAALEVVESEAVLEFAVVVLDPPAALSRWLTGLGRSWS